MRSALRYSEVYGNERDSYITSEEPAWPSKDHLLSKTPSELKNLRITDIMMEKDNYGIVNFGLTLNDGTQSFDGNKDIFVVNRPIKKVILGFTETSNSEGDHTVLGSLAFYDAKGVLMFQYG